MVKKSQSADVRAIVHCAFVWSMDGALVFLLVASGFSVAKGRIEVIWEMSVMDAICV